MLQQLPTLSTLVLVLLGTLPDRVAADQILKTSGFSSCLSESSISVQKSVVEYNNDLKKVTFDLQGTSTKVMNVTAELSVTAYGTEVYKNTFNPCATSTFVQQLCPGACGKERAIPFALSGVLNCANRFYSP